MSNVKLRDVLAVDFSKSQSAARARAYERFSAAVQQSSGLENSECAALDDEVLEFLAAAGQVGSPYEDEK